MTTMKDDAFFVNPMMMMMGTLTLTAISFDALSVDFCIDFSEDMSTLFILYPFLFVVAVVLVFGILISLELR